MLATGASERLGVIGDSSWGGGQARDTGAAFADALARRA